MDRETVVVGAGSSGAVIAARGTESSLREVLLLEAGPDYPPAVLLPEELRDGHANAKTHDWGHQFHPVPGEARLPFPRGKVVGGSSAVNTCIALRGQPYDFDEWAALGLSEWSFEQCLPAFLRLEDDRDIVNEHHHQGGPVPIRRHPRVELLPFQAAFVDAARALGFPVCEDQNDPRPFGVGSQPMNRIDGVRQSASRCYLTREVRSRSNLSIMGDSLVRRVLFRDRRVVGVEVERGSRISVVRCNRVILSAGAVETPGILLRSGIGPREVLAKLRVEVVSDVPAVAARLLDHPGSLMVFVPKRWGFVKNKGPLVQTVLRYSSERSAVPSDMQLQPFSYFDLPGLPFPVPSMGCSVGKPRGFGRIYWTSADPHVKPSIEGNFCMDPEDLAKAVEAMELAGQVARQKPLSEELLYVWPNRDVLRDRESIASWIVKSTGSSYHPAGTVPMGREGDVRAATDGRGRVRGVSGLIVADASLMPTIPSVNTNLTALMIGERFGAWLRDGEL